MAEFLAHEAGSYIFLDEPSDFEAHSPWVSVDDSVPYAPAERDTEDILHCTLRYHPATHLLITINDLELAAAVFPFCSDAAHCVPKRSCPAWPVVQLFLNNVPTKKNIDKGTAGSSASRALLCLLSYLTKFFPVGMTSSSWASTISNPIICLAILWSSIHVQ